MSGTIDALTVLPASYCSSGQTLCVPFGALVLTRLPKHGPVINMGWASRLEATAPSTACDPML